MSESSAADYREQDLDDLMLRWRDAMDDLRLVWHVDNADRTQMAFDAILEYLHAGEVPDVPKSEEQQMLVKVIFTRNLDEGF